MKGWNGGRWSSSSYRHEIGSNGSSSSGTIVSRLSTASASSGSRFSSFSMEAAMHFDSLGIRDEHDGSDMDDWEEAKEERIRSLLQCIKRGDMSVAVERWLTELGVAWVLSLHDGSFTVEEEELDRDARTWIRALRQFAEAIRSTRPLFPDRYHVGSLGLPSICAEEGGHVGGGCILDRYHLALFVQETIAKMLTFIDVLVAWDPNMTQDFLTMDRVMPLPCNKLIIMLDVYKALSSYKILELFDGATSVEVNRMKEAVQNLLSEYKSKVGEAVWSTMEKIRTKLLEDGGSSSSLNSQGSSDIHNVTRSVMTYIELLQKNYKLVGEFIKGHVAYTENIQAEKWVKSRLRKKENIQALSVKSMIEEMMSSLQEKLVNISESFSDQGIKLLFLLNNSYNMHQRIEDIQGYPHPGPLLQLAFDQKIEVYMERYLQVSWAPLLSCLFNPTPLCLAKNHSLLSKFESEFQKTCTTQMEWKVPDPGLRGKLRQAISDKIIPGYTEYIEDNKVTRPKISPHELKAMLQELFEG